MNEAKQPQQLLQEALERAQKEFVRRSGLLGDLSKQLQAAYQQRRELESLTRGSGMELQLRQRQKMGLDEKIKAFKAECDELETSVQRAQQRIEELIKEQEDE